TRATQIRRTNRPRRPGHNRLQAQDARRTARTFDRHLRRRTRPESKPPFRLAGGSGAVRAACRTHARAASRAALERTRSLFLRAPPWLATAGNRQSMDGPLLAPNRPPARVAKHACRHLDGHFLGVEFRRLARHARDREHVAIDTSRGLCDWCIVL